MSKPPRKKRKISSNTFIKDEFLININKLPVELLDIIFSYLNIKELIQLRRVCKYWKCFIEKINNIMYFLRFSNEFGMNNYIYNKNNYLSWKNIYKNEKETFFNVLNDKFSDGYCSLDESSSDSNDYANYYSDEELWKDYIPKEKTFASIDINKQYNIKHAVNYNILSYWAVSRGYYKIVKELIDNNLYEPLCENECDKGNLYFVCKTGDLLMFKLIINKHKDDICSYRSAYNILSTAVDKKQSKIVEELLKLKADPNHEEDGECHLLSRAVTSDNIDTAKLLIKYNADIDGYDWLEYSPIDYVKSYDMLQLLLQNGATDTDIKDKESVLMKLTKKGNIEMIKLLLSYKTGENIQQSISIAKNNNRSDIVDLLTTYKK